jgi:hypothetical protein
MFRYLSKALVIAVVSAGCVARAQDGGAISGAKASPLKPTQNTISGSRLAHEGTLPLRVVVRPADAMKQEDKDLAAGAALTIRQRAEFNDLGFNEGDWQQSQLDCPAFPQHLLLRFTRNRGAGDVSMFTASIPRDKGGRVRVIPILRRGYMLISPAPVNKLTISAFNEIRAEEHQGEVTDWSAESLCYAALSSVRWYEPKADTTITPVGSNTLQLQPDGGLSVALELAAPAPGRWVVMYGRKGQLERAEYTPFGDELWRAMPATVTELKGKPLPPTQDLKGQPLPAGPAEPAGQPIPPTSPDSQSKPQ